MSKLNKEWVRPLHFNTKMRYDHSNLKHGVSLRLRCSALANVKFHTQVQENSRKKRKPSALNAAEICCVRTCWLVIKPIESGMCIHWALFLCFRVWQMQAACAFGCALSASVLIMPSRPFASSVIFTLNALAPLLDVMRTQRELDTFLLGTQKRDLHHVFSVLLRSR